MLIKLFIGLFLAVIVFFFLQVDVDNGEQTSEVEFKNGVRVPLDAVRSTAKFPHQCPEKRKNTFGRNDVFNIQMSVECDSINDFSDPLTCYFQLTESLVELLDDDLILRVKFQVEETGIRVNEKKEEIRQCEFYESSLLTVPKNSTIDPNGSLVIPKVFRRYRSHLNNCEQKKLKSGKVRGILYNVPSRLDVEFFEPKKIRKRFCNKFSQFNFPGIYFWIGGVFKSSPKLMVLGFTGHGKTLLTTMVMALCSTKPSTGLVSLPLETGPSQEGEERTKMMNIVEFGVDKNVARVCHRTTIVDIPGSTMSVMQKFVPYLKANRFYNIRNSTMIRYVFRESDSQFFHGKRPVDFEESEMEWNEDFFLEDAREQNDGAEFPFIAVDAHEVKEKLEEYSKLVRLLRDDGDLGISAVRPIVFVLLCQKKKNRQLLPSECSSGSKVYKEAIKGLKSICESNCLFVKSRFYYEKDNVYDDEKNKDMADILHSLFKKNEMFRKTVDTGKIRRHNEKKWREIVEGPRPPEFPPRERKSIVSWLVSIIGYSLSFFYWIFRRSIRFGMFSISKLVGLVFGVGWKLCFLFGSIIGIIFLYWWSKRNKNVFNCLDHGLKDYDFRRGTPSIPSQKKSMKRRRTPNKPPKGMIVFEGGDESRKVLETIKKVANENFKNDPKSKLGEGGFATVWRMSKEDIKRIDRRIYEKLKPVKKKKFALKVVILEELKKKAEKEKSSLDFEAEEAKWWESYNRLRRHFRNGLLDRRFVCDVHCFFRGSKVLFGYVMELGENNVNNLILNPNLKERLSLETKLEYLMQTMTALESLHENDLVHRDLKWHNVLKCEHGESDRIKLCDLDHCRKPPIKGLNFGDDNGIVTQVHVSGRSAPETIKGLSPDARMLETSSDIYQLGIMMYELFWEENNLWGPSRWDKEKGVCFANDGCQVKGHEKRLIVDTHNFFCGLRPNMNKECRHLVENDEWFKKHYERIVGMMKECWKKEEKERPDIGEVIEFFKRITEELKE